MTLYGLMTYRRLMSSNRLLAPGPVALEQEPPQTAPTLVEQHRSVMILSGHWQRMTTVFAGHRYGSDYLCVDTGYGKRWFPRAQIVRWALTYAGQHRGVSHDLAAAA